MELAHLVAELGFTGGVVEEESEPVGVLRCGADQRWQGVVGEPAPPASVGEPVGCGALKFHGTEPTELKRMWVDPAARGLGVGRRLLTELEARATSHGSRVVRLETNRSLTEAIALYRSAGYHEVDAFNDERYAHHWFEKTLAPATGPAREDSVR